jgi:hypothetical protein
LRRQNTDKFCANHASHCSFFLLSAPASSLLYFLSSCRQSRFQWPPQKFKRFVRRLTLVLTQLPNKLNTNYSSVVSNSMSLSLVRPVPRPPLTVLYLPRGLHLRGRAISNSLGSGYQVKPVWESRPSSTPYSRHTSSTQRVGVRPMSLCVRPRRFRRSLMVRYFLHGFSRLLSCLRRHSRVCLDAVITENGVRLRLNIVDTPGYGDQVNNENW